MAELNPAYYVPLQSLKNLRACMNCSPLKTFKQFYDEGCDNCERNLRLRNNPENIIVGTSLKFEGILGLTMANHTWTCKLGDVGMFSKSLVAYICK